MEQRDNSSSSIFSHFASAEARVITDHELLATHIQACKTLGLRIVMTSGTFDLLHVGHAKYLEKAKAYGDVLLVCVDSDEKVKQRKGDLRPIVSETERVEMLAHLRSVDIITLKHTSDERWKLIKQVRPDTLVVTKETYPPETLEKIQTYCGKILNLVPQATTSTSAQIRKMQVSWTRLVLDPIHDVLHEINAPRAAMQKINKILNKWH